MTRTRVSGRPLPMATALVASPYDDIVVSVSADGVVTSGFRRGQAARAHGRSDVLDAAVVELEEYLAGRREHFDVPVDVAHLSAFQRAVLDLCAAIPFAETRTYGDLARQLGKDPPEGPRAVGQAMATNPVAIIVPCHRVVGARGALVGYGGGPDTGGDLDLKRVLLDHERRVAGRSLF